MEKTGVYFSDLLIKPIQKFFPWLYNKLPWLKKWWVTRKIGRSLERIYKNTLGDEMNIEFKFKEGEENKVINDGETLVIMYDPGENKNENFINAALEVATNCIPNNESILDTTLRQCLSLNFASEIIEEYNPTAGRLFTNMYLLEGMDKNILRDNPYFNKISPMNKKQIFSRMYLKCIIRFANTFDKNSDRAQLKETTTVFTNMMSQFAEDYLQKNIKCFVPDPNNFDKEFEYFYTQNGLSVNLMLVRSPDFFKRNDTEPYFRKAKSLIDKGVDLIFVLNHCDLQNTHRDEYLKRTKFTKSVVQKLKSIRELQLTIDNERPFLYASQEYPVYCALFRKRQ